MIEFYPDIKWVHICAVIASGTLFALRGAGVLAGARWPMWAPLRYLTYTIDTVLLTAALMLVTIVHQYPFVQAWLTAQFKAAAVAANRSDLMSLWSGQGATLLRHRRAAELLGSLIQETDDAMSG